MRIRSIKLPDDLDSELDNAAKRKRMSRGAVVREALAAYLARGDQSVVSKASDLVGSIAGARDLSTGAKHLAGFGE